MAARQVFARAIQKMGLAANTPVAVAVSGGSDSLALTLLARQTFQKVIGITVDHRLREESTLEAERAGELVKSLGLEHYILTLDWEEWKEGEGGGLPSRGKLQLAAREKRYPALLQFCQKMDIRAVMIAHHLDDQNASASGQVPSFSVCNIQKLSEREGRLELEDMDMVMHFKTFFIRMAKGSGVNGLGGMYPRTVWAEFPRVNVLRPLLEARKTDLQEVCRNEGVEWIEDPSNQSDDYIRNNVRKILQENEELNPGITALVKTCQEARTHLKHKASEGLEQINPFVNERDGYLSFSLNRFLSLPPLVTKRIFQSLANHIGGARRVVPLRVYMKIYKQLLSGNKQTETFGNCLLFYPDPEKDTMILARALTDSHKQKFKFWTPISVGQTIRWDGRWRMSLKPLEKLYRREGSIKVPDKVAKKEEQLYVRHMRKQDHMVARRGIRRIRASTLPIVNCRGGLPVVCTKSGYVVLAPHFNVIDYSYGVYCDIAFDPLLPLPQDSDTHVC